MAYLLIDTLKKIMLKSIFLSVIMTILSYNAYSQDLAKQNLMSNNGMIYSFDTNDSSIKGTPYIMNEFMPGEIYFNNQSKIYNVRYNALNDVFEIKKNDGDLDTLNKFLTDVTITFVKDKKSYRAYNYTENNDSKTGYFVIISDEKRPLLVKERIIFTEQKQAKSSYHKATPAQYSRKKDVYFTLNDSGNAIELPSNKKDLAKTFPNHSKDILEYIKANKIKTSKETDLIKLLNYINTL